MGISAKELSPQWPRRWIKASIAILEVDKLVNPRKHTLTEMIMDRCPSLMVQRPCSRKSYCQTQVRFSDQKDAECVIKAIAQSKGVTGFRIREVDRVFESPR